MRLKKAQLTIFIIIAILVVLVVVLLIFLLPKKNVSRDTNVNNAIVLIENCLDESLEKGIVYIGSTGGYYSTQPQISENYLGRDISVYVANNFAYLPSKTLMENELSSFIADDLRSCIASTEFSNVDSVTVNNLVVSSKLYNDKAVVSVFSDIKIIKDEISFKIDTLDSSEKTEFMSLYNLAIKLSTQQRIEKGGLCITCFADWESKENINILIYDFAPESPLLLYTLQSKNLGANPDLVFQFFAERVDYETYH